MLRVQRNWCKIHCKPHRYACPGFCTLEKRQIFSYVHVFKNNEKITGSRLWELHFHVDATIYNIYNLGNVTSPLGNNMNVVRIFHKRSHGHPSYERPNIHDIILDSPLSPSTVQASTTQK